MSASRVVLAAAASACLLGGPACEPAPPGGANAGGGALPRFEDVTAASGIDFVNVSGSPEKRWIYESTAGGGAVLDYDGDGLLDLYLVSGGRTLEPAAGDDAPAPLSRLYRNLGGGVFADVTREARAGVDGWGQGAVAADYDGDGDPDLFVTRIGADVLLRNEGNGAFRDVTAAAGVGGDPPAWSTGAAFADVDGDGALDLFVAGYVAWDPARPPAEPNGCEWADLEVFCGPMGLPGEADRFFRQTGDGTFSEQTAAAGLVDTERRYGLGVVFLDHDGDGDPDLYVANDSNANSFYVNRGDGTFVERGLLCGVAYNADGFAQAGMGVAAGDLDGDGRTDLFVTNFDRDTNTFYRNRGDGFFEDATAQARLVEASYAFMGWGAAAEDFDNDGDIDLYCANGHIFPAVEGKSEFGGYGQRDLLFLNDGDGRFREAGLETGLTARASSRGVLAVDIDDDGDVDVVTLPVDGPPSVLRNRAPEGNAWLDVLPVGAGRNRDAVGARVVVTSAGRTQVREIRRGEGYLSSHDPRLHFGLGRDPGTVRVEVTFRGGKKVATEGVRPGCLVVVEETSGAARERAVGAREP